MAKERGTDNEDLYSMDVEKLLKAACKASFDQAWRLQENVTEDNQCRAYSKRCTTATELLLEKVSELSTERDKLREELTAAKERITSQAEALDHYSNQLNGRKGGDAQDDPEYKAGD